MIEDVIGVRIRARHVGSISAPFATPSVPFELEGFLDVQAAPLSVRLYRAEETQERSRCSRAPSSKNKGGRQCESKKPLQSSVAFVI
jgi:hypothetical protein